MEALATHGVLVWAFVVASCIAVLVYLAGVISAIWHLATRQRRTRAVGALAGPWPGVSLLKPIKGLEDGLEENLRSALAQAYPGPMQIVFSSADADDPGLAVARAVAAEFPDRDVCFVVSKDRFGWNPKVSNLKGGLDAARHDLVLQTDANVRMQPGYVRQLVGEMRLSGSHMVTSLVAGIGERDWGAALENLQLCAFTAPATCAALRLAGIPCVIGKSMLMRQSDIRRAGGIEVVKDVLAEDFVLGARFAAAGMRVEISPTCIHNVNHTGGLERFVSRHARWLKMRTTVSVSGFVADLLANPLPLACAAWIAAEFDRGLVTMPLVILLFKPLLDRAMVRWVRGTALPWRYVPLAPVRDLCLAVLWCHALVSRRVSWRGERFRLGPGSRLEPLDGLQRSVSLAPAASAARLDEQRQP